ncbi:MAG: shikimate kinase [Nitrospirota bacterium]|nr:shikimate kinase [Nitrospirota bacterium]
MNIVLIGYRGTGKSSVASVLASRLRWERVSTDAEIVTRAKQSIPEIVKSFGWEHFRNLESEVCREVGGKDHLIIDTGGGVILRPQNIETLKANGRLFWLTAEIPTIEARIGGDTQRPSLTGTKSFIEEIADVLEERCPKYRAAADHVIPTDHQSVAQVVDAIRALM